jgi:hypothetical protein
VGKTILIGLVVGIVVASFLTVRRRRRLHRRMAAESVAAMAGCLKNGPTPVVRALRDAALRLADQDRVAERVDEEIRPYLHKGQAETRPGDRVAAAVHELRTSARLRGDPEPETGVRCPATGPVPDLDAAPELAEAYEALLITVRGRIRQAGLIVLLASALGVSDEETRERLADSLRDAEAARQAGEAQAGRGQMVAAVYTLAHIDAPIPDDGVPGAATRRDTERHSALLREIAEVHEARLLGWLTDAGALCVRQKGGTAA